MNECWFCGNDVFSDAYFSVEFDTFYHGRCLTKALRMDADNQEARIILQERNDV